MECPDLFQFLADLGIDFFPGDSFPVLVVHVWDGDTVDVRSLAGGRPGASFRVRLGSIDSPEISSSSGVENPAAIFARNYLVSLLDERGRSMPFAPTGVSHRRVAGLLSWPGVSSPASLSHAMVAGGWAGVHPVFGSSVPGLRPLCEEARRLRLGIWAF